MAAKQRADFRPRNGKPRYTYFIHINKIARIYIFGEKSLQINYVFKNCQMFKYLNIFLLL